jgi:hypothetical protein
VFATSNPFHPSLIFAVKAGAYQSGARGVLMILPL